MNKFINALIIDDDNYKASEIERILRKLGIEEVRSLINADNKYDLLILDNCFPNYDGSFPERDMGLDFLYRCSKVMSYREFVKDLKIIMCSSDKLEVPEYDNLNVLGSIQYSSSVYMDPYFEELIMKEE